MIVLLNYSINSYGNSNISFTGELDSDSILIAYSDLKIVNSKLIELEFQKEINFKLQSIIELDSIIIDTLLFNNNNLITQNNKLNKKVKRYKKQRNIVTSIGIVGIITTIVALIK
jgi:hypothetical protein